jgi:hypothetical protein
MMTRERFNDISLGSSVVEVTSKGGEPYKIRSKGGGIDEYEYIEKVNVAGDTLQENHYFISISGGKVVGKRVSTQRQPAYDLIYQEDPNYPNLKGAGGS